MNDNDSTPATIPNSPSRTPPKSPSEFGSESNSDEIRSAFVPIRLNTLPPTTSVITASSSSPERIVPKKPVEGTRNKLKMPVSPNRTPSPTKISSPLPAKAVWRPY
nr:PREDICTED: uncharacterized protein LOC105662403 [Megachile rotundata]